MDQFKQTTSQARQEGSGPGTPVMTAEEYFGYGTEEVSTPTQAERFKRRRTASEGSPRDEEEEEESVTLAVEELRGYIAKNFAQKHSGYFEKRFRSILAAQMKLEQERRRAARVADRLAQVEKTLKNLVEGEWAKDVVTAVKEEVEGVCSSMVGLIEAVLGRNKETLERIRGHVDGALDTMTAHDADRGRDLLKVEDLVKDGVARMTKEVRMVAKEMEPGRGCMDEVKSCMDRVFERVSAVHEVVRPLEVNVRKVEGKLERMNVEEVKEKVECLVNRVTELKPSERMEVDECKEGEWAKVVKRGQRGPRVVVEVPGDKGFREKKEEVVKCLDPKGGEVRVRGLRRKGKDVVVEVKDTTDVARLNDNVCMKEAGMKVKGMEGWRSPRVKIYDVSTEIRKEDLRECVRRRNPELFVGMNDDEVDRAFVPEFTLGRAKEWCEWVVRVSPRLFSRAMLSGRVFVGVRVCRVVEYLGVRRCGKCHRFGHSGARCDAPTVCGFCGVEGHHAARCSKGGNPEAVKCVNCVRYEFKEVHHPVYWPGCPVNMLQQRLQRNNTSYEEY